MSSEEEQKKSLKEKIIDILRKIKKKIHDIIDKLFEKLEEIVEKHFDTHLHSWEKEE